MFKPPRSLVFFHVAKTGGTSATAALKPYFQEAVTSGGNLSAACLASRPGAANVLFHGHPEHGVAWAVPPGAVTATVLRAPDEQAVSNYYHLLRNPGLPLHEPAVRLGFSALMAAHWQLLAFQAISLDVAISSVSIATPEMLFGRLPAIRQFLSRIDVVGSLGRLDAFLREAALRTNHPIPAMAHRLNGARDFGVDRRELERRREDYHALAADPLLGRLMRMEASLVTEAEARGRIVKSWRLPIRASRAWRPGTQLSNP